MISQVTRDTLFIADPDRLRAATFAATRLKEKLELFYAFHYELAKVPEFVSEPMIGQIRYQWWRDVVAEIYEKRPVRSHEISTPLAKMLIETDMPRFWVDRLIDARERDLDPTPFTDIDAAKDYARETSGLLLQMAVHIAAHESEISALDDTSLVLAGQAWGLTGLARSWRFYHQSMLSELNFKELCQSSLESYATAREGLGAIPAGLLPAVSYTGLVPNYVIRMTSSRHDPEQHMPSYAPPLKHFRLLGVTFRGRI